MSADPNKKIKLLFACLDWRLHPAIENFFIREGQGCDLCVTAGSIKGLNDPATRGFFVEQIAVSKKLHNCAGVILTSHLDCGAYGGSAAFGANGEEFAHHKEQLRLAKEIVSRNFPGLPVETCVIGLKREGNGWSINPQAVEL